MSRWRSAPLAIAVVVSGCGKVSATASDGASAHDAGPDAPVPSSLALTTGMIMPILGTTGDPFTDGCPDGQALIGLEGSVGVIPNTTPVTVVGQVIGHCGMVAIDPAGAAGDFVTWRIGGLLPARGGATDTPWSSLCDPGEFVVGIAVHDGDALDQLAAICAPLTLTAQDTAWVTHTGPASTKPSGGGLGGHTDSDLCPDGQIATVLAPRVLSATTTRPAVLGSIGIECSVVTAQ